MRLFRLILALMLVASIVPTVMVGYTSVSRTRELLVRDAQELAQERVKQLKLKTEMLLDEPTRAVLSLARVPGFFSLPLPEQQSHIAAVLKQRPEVTIVTIFAADGARLPGLQGFAVADVPPTEVAVHESRSAELLQKARTGLFIGEVRYSAALKAPVVTVAYPLGDPPNGFVAADLALANLVRMLEKEPLGSTGFAYVVDERGRLVAGPALQTAQVGADLSERPAVAQLLATLKASGPGSLKVGNFGAGDERVVGAWSFLENAGWAVVSEQPIQLAYRQVDTMREQILLGVLGASLVALGLAALFSRTLSKPLKKFDAAAMEIARGKYGVQVDFRSNNELGDLAKTFNYMSAQIDAYDHETKRLYESLENGYLETIVALANSIDSKDAYTRGHSQRVGDVAVEIGRELGLTERELKQLHYGGILHDIGKIGIAEHILCKQSRLTDDEMVVMRDHPLIGDTIIGPVSFLAPVRAAVRNHHERWDGTGYPDRLKGEQIPLIARIVNCADTFDACTSTRPYQKAMPLERAWAVMESLRGTQLDPDVLDALKRVIEKKGVRLEGSQTLQKLAG